MQYLGKYSVSEVDITACDYEHVISKVVLSAKKKKSLLVAPVATHPLTVANEYENYRQLLNSFDLVLPDSQYLRLALKLMHGAKIPSRIYGPELFRRICESAERHTLKILLYGNHLDKLAKVLKETYPCLLFHTVDVTSIKVGPREIEILKRSIYKYDPDIVVIGVGSPLQHNIMGQLRDLSCPVIAVGAAFDFVSGIKPQAPDWIGNLGFEWLYRLILEPGRLWKRYLLGGPIFIALIIKQRFKVFL